MFNTKNSFHVTAKPIGAECNLSCDYCYYLHKKETLSSSGKMSDTTLENFIEQYIESQATDTVFFTWHGGEPTLLGIDFFRKVVELQKKYAKYFDKKVENDLQTNGILLNDEWCKFLKENHFLVGLSIDGPESCNIYRKTLGGTSSTEQVLNAAYLLRKYAIPFNTLTVVHYENAKKPLEVYHFLKDIVKSKHIQFIPCVEPKNFQAVTPLIWDIKTLPTEGSSAAKPRTANSFVTDFTVDSEEFGNFLSAIFDEWYEKDQGSVFVYLFENFLSLWLDRGPLTCLFDKKCGHAMALDRDGRVYACDHFCYSTYSYGNINSKYLSSMALSMKKNNFSSEKERLPKQCSECKWLSKCYGECPKKRFIKTKDGKKGLNYLCTGYRNFFSHIEEKMANLVKIYGHN